MNGASSRSARTLGSVWIAAIASSGPSDGIAHDDPVLPVEGRSGADLDRLVVGIAGTVVGGELDPVDRRAGGGRCAAGSTATPRADGSPEPSLPVSRWRGLTGPSIAPPRSARWRAATNSSTSDDPQRDGGVPEHAERFDAPDRLAEPQAGAAERRRRHREPAIGQREPGRTGHLPGSVRSGALDAGHVRPHRGHPPQPVHRFEAVVVQADVAARGHHGEPAGPGVERPLEGEGHGDGPAAVTHRRRSPLVAPRRVASVTRNVLRTSIRCRMYRASTSRSTARPSSPNGASNSTWSTSRVPCSTGSKTCSWRNDLNGPLRCSSTNRRGRSHSVIVLVIVHVIPKWRARHVTNSPNPMTPSGDPGDGLLARLARTTPGGHRSTATGRTPCPGRRASAPGHRSEPSTARTRGPRRASGRVLSSTWSWRRRRRRVRRLAPCTARRRVSWASACRDQVEEQLARRWPARRGERGQAAPQLPFAGDRTDQHLDLEHRRCRRSLHQPTVELEPGDELTDDRDGFFDPRAPDVQRGHDLVERGPLAGDLVGDGGELDRGARAPSDPDIAERVARRPRRRRGGRAGTGRAARARAWCCGRRPLPRASGLLRQLVDRRSLGSGLQCPSTAVRHA